MSVYTTAFAGSVPAGGLLMGWIASSWGVPLALLVGAVVTLVIGVGGFVWLGRIRGDRLSHALRERAQTAQRAAVARADIGAIDPEGRSAGQVSTARPK